MNLQDVAAIVTGGASGLGGATAEMLARQGAKVAIFDLNETLGAAHAAKIGGKFFKMNVTDDASVLEGVAAAEAAHGIARVLVNCAGVASAIKTVGREFKPYPLADFRKVIEINLIGTFNVIAKFAARAATLEPLGEERGVIINTASAAAWTPMMASLPPAAQESLGKQVPFPSRLGQPEEYAQLVESIIANPMLNGEVIRLDGAIRMAPK
jgi:NAD(P)-dependent dehydrogenase (short-subunit alcohol dehydrogenase family)